MQTNAGNFVYLLTPRDSGSAGRQLMGGGGGGGGGRSKVDENRRGARSRSRVNLNLRWWRSRRIDFSPLRWAVRYVAILLAQKGGRAPSSGRFISGAYLSFAEGGRGGGAGRAKLARRGSENFLFTLPEFGLQRRADDAAHLQSQR